MYDFSRWSNTPKILKRAGITKAQLQKSCEDNDYDIADKIQNVMTKDELTEFATSLDANESPTWTSMDYSKLLPRNTWLVHFSKNANDIQYQGFKYGVEDPERLAFTKGYISNKQYSGYNFAFIADSGEAVRAARTKKYGDHAVMFQASGVLAYHYGDEENQVMFWGPAISPGSLVYLHRDGNTDNWCVQGSGPSKRDYLYQSENFNDVVNWVENHNQQYRKQLFTLPPKGWHKKYSES